MFHIKITVLIYISTNVHQFSSIFCYVINHLGRVNHVTDHHWSLWASWLHPAKNRGCLSLPGVRELPVPPGANPCCSFRDVACNENYQGFFGFASRSQKWDTFCLVVVPPLWNIWVSWNYSSQYNPINGKKLRFMWSNPNATLPAPSSFPPPALPKLRRLRPGLAESASAESELMEVPEVPTVYKAYVRAR